MVTLLLEVFRKTEKSNGSGLIFRDTDIFFKESLNLWSPLLMIALYLDQDHQSVFGVGEN